MDNHLYDMIFKRKSFHLFGGTLAMSEKDLEGIRTFFSSISPLYKDIKVEMKIFKAEETSCHSGGSHCLCFYSEKKDNYLLNIGYMGEQMDLYLASQNIGACWCGMARTKEKHSHLPFVIMMSIGKKREDEFRKDMFSAKRKSLQEIYTGEPFPLLNIARFSPSACNTQPWSITEKEGEIIISRVLGKRGIMPLNKVTYFNRLDLGIFLCIFELCLHHDGLSFTRSLLLDDGDNERLLTPTAIYRLNK